MAASAREYLDWLPLFAEQTEDAVLARMIDWANEGLTPDSELWVDTREGSMWRTAVMPCIREIVRLIDMAGVDVPASASPLRSWGPYLDELAEVVDLARLPATYAEGTVRFTGDAGTIIPAGAQVGVPPSVEGVTVPTFQVTTQATIAPAALTPPTGVTATPSGTGGTMAAGTYYYRVTALNAWGETLGSIEQSATVPGGGTGSVAITWTPPAGTVTGYRIYRGASTGSQDTYYTDAASPFTDTGAAGTAGTVPTANTTAGRWVDVLVTAVEAGQAGNVSANAITEVLTPIAGVTVNNALPTTGGSDPETDFALRTRLLDAYRGQGAGNPGDYRRWAGSRAGVGRVTVIPVWDGPGTVLIVLYDNTGQPVSTAIVNDVQTFLDPVDGAAEGYAPIGINVTVTTPTVLDITISADIEPEPGYSLDGTSGTTPLRQELKDAVNAYLRTIESGGEVVRVQVEARLVDVHGVHDVANVTLSGAGANGNVTVPSDPARVPISTTQTYTEVTL